MSQKWQETVSQIRRLVEDHHAYRGLSLNMVAAENVTSPLVEHIIGSDFSRRYSSPGVYAGDRHYLPLYEMVVDLMAELFKATYVNIKPATGNLAVMAILTALTKPGDKIIRVGDQHGGYPTRLAEWGGVEIVPFPFDFERLNIRVQEAIEQVRQVRPKLVVFGASEFLFPHPVREISAVAHEVGALVAYDGSHVMGLIAGGVFQDPLREGADVLYGSTHKTFPGPQRGMIATNNVEVIERIDHVLAPPPFLLSCYHLNTVVALGVAAAEMLAFGQEYAAGIVRNAQALARGLVSEGVPVIAPSEGFTQSHQVLLDNGGFVSPEGQRIKARLEDCGILADAVVRIGTQEVTRLGMGQAEMSHIASLMADAIRSRRPDEAIRADVASLAAAFQRLHFTFDTETTGYSFPSEHSVTQPGL